MLEDRYGSPITTTSKDARDAYVDGIDRFIGAMDGVENAYHAAIAADENFAMPHLGLARFYVTTGRPADAKAELTIARKRAEQASPREAAQIDIIGDLIEGRGPQGYQRVRQHVAEHPRDIMLAQTCAGVFGLIGFSGQSGREAEQLAYMSMLKPHYGDDWWFLCQHAFAQMEAGQIGPAEANIERSLQLRPDAAHSAHVRSHLYYENGASGEGYAYLKDFWGAYQPSAYLHCHISWHVALWALDLGDMDAMWQIFEHHVVPERKGAPPLNIMTDSVAILYRAGLAGETVPRHRWQQISDYAAAKFPAPGLAFADAHAALAHAMAGERDRLETVIEGAKGPAAPVVASVAKAFRALAEDRPDGEAAIAHLVGIMGEHERLGGSRAQRDLVEFALAQALITTGQKDEATRILRMHRPHAFKDHALAGLV